MKIYLSGEYVYRRWQTLLGGIMGLIFGAIPLWCIISGRLDGSTECSSRPSIPTVLFVGGISVMLLLAGFWLVQLWLSKRVIRLEISDNGVRYGTTYRPWDKIKRFAWSFDEIGDGPPTLYYKKKGFPFDYYLPLTSPLSREKADALLAELKKDIAPLHKDLRIG